MHYALVPCPGQTGGQGRCCWCMLDAEIKGGDITSRPLGSTEPENWVQLPATCLEFPLTASPPRPPALFSQPSQHLANDGRSSTAQTSSRADDLVLGGLAGGASQFVLK